MIILVVCVEWQSLCLQENGYILFTSASYGNLLYLNNGHIVLIMKWELIIWFFRTTILNTFSNVSNKEHTNQYFSGHNKWLPTRWLLKDVGTRCNQNLIIWSSRTELCTFCGKMFSYVRNFTRLSGSLITLARCALKEDGSCASVGEQ